jgi:hypothetical protein
MKNLHPLIVDLLAAFRIDRRGAYAIAPADLERFRARLLGLKDSDETAAALQQALMVAVFVAERPDSAITAQEVLGTLAAAASSIEDALGTKGEQPVRSDLERRRRAARFLGSEPSLARAAGRKR